MDYTVTLTVGTWTAVINDGDAAVPVAGAIALDGLTASWSMKAENYPCQPDPTTLQLDLYVPTKAAGPSPAIGQTVECTLVVNGGGAGVDPLLYFHGTVTDADAEPLRDGLQYALVAVDHTAQLGEAGAGSVDYPLDFRYQRVGRIVNEAASAGLPVSLVGGAGEASKLLYASAPSCLPRSASPTSVASLLEDTFAAYFTFLGAGADYWTTGHLFAQFDVPGRTTWCRPYVGQSVDGAGNVTLPVCLQYGSAPDSSWSLPYQLVKVGGVWSLQRKAGTSTNTDVPWIPAAAVKLEGLKWRQDKAGRPNRVRINNSGPLSNGQNSVTVDLVDLVAAGGPIETVLQLDAQPITTDLPLALAAGLLGTRYDADPGRWNLDSFTILPEKLGAPDTWPRLFSPKAHTRPMDQAAGKLVILTDVPDKWSLHPRPDYFGRLVGASLTVSDSKIRMSAELLHRLPMSPGRESDPDQSGAGQVHVAVTYAQLTAAATANPRYVDLPAALTYADLMLTETA